MCTFIEELVAFAQQLYTSQVHDVVCFRHVTAPCSPGMADIDEQDHVPELIQGEAVGDHRCDAHGVRRRTQPVEPRVRTSTARLLHSAAALAEST